MDGSIFFRPYEIINFYFWYQSLKNYSFTAKLEFEYKGLHQLINPPFFKQSLINSEYILNMIAVIEMGKHTSSNKQSFQFQKFYKLHEVNSETILVRHQAGASTLRLWMCFSWFLVVQSFIFIVLI